MDMKQNDPYLPDKKIAEPPATLRESAEKLPQEDLEHKNTKQRAAAKCECPPGCVGLPCCT